jgi:hypothetical protein
MPANVTCMIMFPSLLTGALMLLRRSLLSLLILTVAAWVLSAQGGQGYASTFTGETAMRGRV